MTTTHVGKIGRLPCWLRDELGRRIEEGVPGREIVQWLNGEEEVQASLRELFDGRPITEQNLSQWKQTGYVEWLRREQARLNVRELAERGNALDEAADGPPITDRFASVLAAEMTQLAERLMEQSEADPEKRWARLCRINRELAILRREDHRAGRLAIQRGRWQKEEEDEMEAGLKRTREESKQRLIDQLLSPLNLPVQVKVLETMGAGPYARQLAELIDCIKRDEPYHELLAKLGARPGKPDSASGPAPKTPAKTGHGAPECC